MKYLKTIDSVFKQELPKKEFEFENNKIQVYQTIATKEKEEIVNRAIELSIVNKVINETALEAIFHALILVFYTDIEIDKEFTFDPLELERIYDVYKKNGVLMEVLKLIPQEEYKDLAKDCETTVERYNQKLNSLVGVIEMIGKALPTVMEQVNEYIQTNPEVMEYLNKIIPKDSTENE